MYEIWFKPQETKDIPGYMIAWGYILSSLKDANLTPDVALEKLNELMEEGKITQKMLDKNPEILEKLKKEGIQSLPPGFIDHMSKIMTLQVVKSIIWGVSEQKVTPPDIMYEIADAFSDAELIIWMSDHLEDLEDNIKDQLGVLSDDDLERVKNTYEALKEGVINYFDSIKKTDLYNKINIDDWGFIVKEDDGWN